MKTMPIYHHPPNMRLKAKLKSYTQFLALLVWEEEAFSSRFDFGSFSIRLYCETCYATRAFTPVLKADHQPAYARILSLIRLHSPWFLNTLQVGTTATVVISAPPSPKYSTQILDFSYLHNIILRYALPPSLHRPYRQDPPLPYYPSIPLFFLLRPGPFLIFIFSPTLVQTLLPLR